MAFDSSGHGYHNTATAQVGRYSRATAAYIVELPKFLQPPSSPLSLTLVLLYDRPYGALIIPADSLITASTIQEQWKVSFIFSQASRGGK